MSRTFFCSDCGWLRAWVTWPGSALRRETTLKKCNQGVVLFRVQAGKKFD